MTIEEYKEIIKNNIYYHPSLETMILGRKLSIPKKHSKDNKINGHEYIDLGLPSGTLWATMNVGALSETDYGNHYMYGMGSNIYNDNDTPYDGTENPLDLSKDTARQTWGGGWHMPTKAQFEELITNTNNSLITINGRNGYKFTNKTDDSKYIFLPAAGAKSSPGNWNYKESRGLYYSSNTNDANAYYLAFTSSVCTVNAYTSRAYGYSVRPVADGSPVEHDDKKVICVYNITTTEEPTLLLLGEDVACYRPDTDIYEIFSGMEIDGVEQELDLYYLFNTTGEHVIKYTLNDNVTNFEGAFFNVDNLNSIIIPNNITIIDELAFLDCNNLKSINTGDSVTSIERLALDQCNNLESIIIGNSVTNIDSDFINFLYKSELNSIIVNSKNNKYDSRNNCNALIETASNTLILGSKSTVIPNTVTSIEGGAFGGCSGLTSITIPNSVTSIGDGAFSSCTGLISIVIPDSVTDLGEAVFYDCASLTSVTIGNSVTSIGYTAFWNCVSLTSLTIGNSVTSIGLAAFNGCESLVSVTIPNSVTNIGFAAFSNCNDLTSVTIGNSVTTIEGYAFHSCSSLTSVNIPNSVTSIGRNAFSSCSSLTSVTINNSIPPTLNTLAFYNNANNRKIYVPAESVNTYKAAAYWNDYANDIEPIP